jgi:hypothetical protein
MIEETEMGYLATIAVTDGCVRFAFEDIEQMKAGELNAEVTVWREVPGVGSSPFSCRTNTMSLSARETLRRALDDAWGAAGWSRHIGQACSELKSAWRKRERDKWIENARDPEADRFCLPPYLLSRGATVWFGDAGTGKTTLALWCAKQLGCVVMWLDFEWEESEIKRIWTMLGGGKQTLRYWNAEGGALADEVVAIRRDLRRSGADYIMLDSAAAACDGEPEKADVTNRYFRALQALAAPSLTIAHVNNAGEDQRPFGSRFWYHRGRLLWNVKADRETQGELHQGFFCRKANVGSWPEPFGMLLEYQETGIGISNGRVWPEFAEHMGTKTRIRALLEQGKKTRREIASELDLTDTAVRKALQRMPEAMSSGRSPHSEWWLKA